MSKKFIQDCIYGLIKIPKDLIPYIDNPYFQRLRRIKQLSNCSFLYPSATHTRLEHSIGVMYMANRFIQSLEENHEIPENHKRLILIAALYHDIGHSAFSHLFDQFLGINPAPGYFSMADHEERSIAILRIVAEEIGDLTEEDILTIENIILGRTQEGQPNFWHQIINNKLFGIDADRTDYILRDSYHIGLKVYSPDMLIECMTVDSNGNLAFFEKARKDVQLHYAARETLFDICYAHKSTVKFDRMIYCALNRLGPKISTYGIWTDDYNLETLIRNDPDCKDLMKSLDNRQIDHSCSHCENFVFYKKPSGKIDNITFI